jgi:ABC-type multidrug transport system ATPase subunit
MSIHQPSTATFNLFDKLALLSQGKMHYFGPVGGVTAHYEALGRRMPVHINPAEFLLEMVSTDFAADRIEAAQRLGEMQRAGVGSRAARELAERVAAVEEKGSGRVVELEMAEVKPGLLSVVLTLLHRSFVKSYRDVVVYGIRLAMYIGEWCP